MQDSDLSNSCLWSSFGFRCLLGSLVEIDDAALAFLKDELEAWISQKETCLVNNDLLSSLGVPLEPVCL